jgi:autotransporter-associated beta strand protein/T5SS/PEP-CTERM-associated repeat protein
VIRSLRLQSARARRRAPAASVAVLAIAAAAPAARTRAALLGGVWLGAFAALLPQSAQAVDGTWTGPGAEWTTGTNWSSSPTVPDNTATFTGNGAPTSVTISSNASINTIDFDASAPAYSFLVQNGATFTINNAINNSSSFAPAFSVNGGATLALGNGVFAAIGSLADGPAGGGSVQIGTSNPNTTLSIAGNSSTTFSGSFAGAGSLELDNGATLTLTGASNGRNIGTIGGDLTLCNCSTGGLTIDGGALTVNGLSMGVTVFGGTLSVINGGTLQIGPESGSNNADLLVASDMLVSGAGSSVTVSGFTGIGVFGPGMLTISNGGVLNSQSGAEIDSFFGVARATVTGAGSTWNIGGSGLEVGGGSTGGIGRLTISGGAVVNSTLVSIGDAANGSSRLTVTGAGSVLNAGALSIGDTDCGCGPLVGTLTIADGGAVNSLATRILAGSTLNLGTGGLAGSITTPFIFNRGEIVANFTDTLTLGANISGSGSLSKAGVGTLILTGANTYSGPTTINAGTLRVDGSLGTGAVTVANAATLTGAGSIGGAVTVQNGGILAGATGSTLTMSSLVLNASSNTNVAIGRPSATLFDVSGNLTIAGTVNITNAGGYGSGVYHLFEYGGTLTDNGMTIGSQPPGFTTSINTTTAQQVNLTVFADPTATQFWQGASVPVGGSGTWNAANTNWLNADGSVSTTWGGQQAIFHGTPGTVTIDGAQAFTSLEFVVDGYNLVAGAGGALTPTGMAQLWAEGTRTTATIAAPITGAGGIVKIGAGTIVLSGANTYLGGTVIQAGTLAVSADNNLGDSSGGLSFDGGTLRYLAGFASNRAVTLDAGGGTFDTNGNNATLTGAIGGGGRLRKIGAGILTLAGGSNYSGPTEVNAGTLQAGAVNAFSPLSAFTVAAGAVLDLNNLNQTIGSLAGTAGSRVTLGSATLTAGGDNASTTFAGVIEGTGGLTKVGTGTLTLSGANTYTGGTTLAAGRLRLANNQALGTGALTTLGSVVDYASGVTIANAIVVNSNTTQLSVTSGSATQAGVISELGGPRPLEKIGAGTLVLTAANTYSGPTTVNAGALVVNGSIANSAVTVNAGALLAGTGTVGATTIASGGMFGPGSGTPGSSMTVAGNLAFQSGALYLVQVNPSTASSANATGSATLAGTVSAALAPGSYVTRSYTILSAAGGLNGTTFNALTSNLPAGFRASLSYTANDVILNLTASLGTIGTTGLSINQRNVANALDGFFNRGGALPPNFAAIFGLTGSNLANALTALSGEAATGAQQVGFQMTNQFLGLMLDPFVDGRGSGVSGTSGPALGFAPEQEALPEDIALAYSSALKAPALPAATFDQRWTAWGGAYGGGNKTSGDPAVLGSHDLTANTAGFAAGLDYRLSPNSVVGIALAGGGTNWSLSQGLGGGKSDAFQAGVYGATRWGAAYLAGAFAFTNHWMSTDRFAFAGDHLTASFNAQSYGGRVEGGYRFATFFGGITPYAAIQAQSFHTPGYAEVDGSGGGFALSYNARTGSDTRSELGARFDRLIALYPGAALSLRGRLAWAHDWVNDPSLAAVFQTLPGASFIVNGAVPAKDSALVSAGAEYRLANGLTLLGKFDGEFASRSTTYAGTGTVRYSW